MAQSKDFGRRLGKLAGAVRRATGALVEGLEQRMLLADAPTLDWSSYLGGGGEDMGAAIAVDGNGDVWVAGRTGSPDFAGGGFDNSYRGNSAFVAKIHADGALVWSICLGGGVAMGMAIDGDGNAWVTGRTDSTDFASGGFDTSYGGNGDAFVAKINSDGSLAWASYLGGTGADTGAGIAIDGSGNAWVTGWTNSTDFASGGTDTSYGGGYTDAFVAKINADGTLAWSSYWGGFLFEEGHGIAIDGNGNAWVTGLTGLDGYGPSGHFLAKINADGTLAWSNDLGGEGIAIDGSGNAWVIASAIGSTPASGGFDTSCNGGSDAFIEKINTDGTLLWSSYLGGEHDDVGIGIAVDGRGNAWVSGKTASSGWTSGGFDTSYKSISGTAFLAKINADGTLAWSSYVGGDRWDEGDAIVPDDNGSAWVTGWTRSPGWTSDGFDTCFNGYHDDAFVAKISDHAHAPVVADQALTTHEEMAISGAVTGIDANGDALSYGTAIMPKHGALSFQSDGTFTYTPGSNYYGPDSFTYTANDGTWDSNTATVNITVMPQRQWPREGPDTVGREFWLAFMPSGLDDFLPGDGGKCLYLSSRQEARVTVEIPGMRWAQGCVVEPGEVTTVQVPWNACDSGVDNTSDVGIHVTSDQEIAVYGMNQGDWSTDGFTAVPADVLGTSYIAVTCLTWTGWGCGPQLAVVGTEDGTRVTITPSVDANGHPAGIPYDVVLARGQVYQLRTALPPRDLTGTRIDADRPVAVFSGNGYPVEQLIPIDDWGDHFITVPVAPGRSDDTFRVLAAEDGTEVRINGILRATLSATQYCEWLSDSPQEITTSKSVTVAQYVNGCADPWGNYGGPILAIIPPADSSLTDYMMSTRAYGLGSHFINFWTAVGTTVLLDGNAISQSEFTPVGDSGYVTASIRVDVGTHIVNGSAPVGVMLYGWATADSYAFVGGETLHWDPPSAVDQTITVEHDTLYAGNVFATGAYGQSIAYTVSTLPEHGELLLQSDGTFTYMPDTGYVGPDLFRFWASDDPAVSSSGTVSITVKPPNRNPVIADQNLYVAEHSLAGALVGVVQASDPDGDGLRFAILGGDPNGVFALDATTGEIRVVRTEYLDYETMPRRYDLRVEVTDDGVPNLSDQATVTINVITGWTTDITLSNATVAENQPAGTVVGALLSSDLNGGNTITYTLADGSGGNDNGNFAIVGDQLLTAASFNYEVRNSYSIRVRASKSSSESVEKAFSIAVTNVNEAPLDLALSGPGVPEGQPVGTTVGRLSATCADGTESITFALVSGPGADDNASFRIVGNRLITAITFNYVRGREYAVRIRATDSGGLSVEKELGIPGVPVFEFGQVDGRQNKNLSIADGDGDVVTFKLSGGGMGSSWGNQVGLINTTAKSVLSISVKRGKNGDGLYHIGDITSDGLLKSVSAKSVVLSGEVLLNSLGRSAGKTAVSLAFRQISDADICVQGLAVSSITVGGWVTGSRIMTTGSIGKFSAAAMAHSSVLVGVDTSFEGRFAGHDDFTNTGATLGKLTIKGLKRSKGSPSPAYVLNSHISAPSMGSVSLVNVWDNGKPVVHVLNDVGVLKVSVAPLADVAVFAGGTWSKAGVRPALWETLT